MSHDNGVFLARIDHVIDGGGEPGEGLAGSLFSKYKLVRTTEELLDRTRELVPCREVWYAAPVMLLQSTGGPDGNLEPASHDLRGLDRLGLSAGPDRVGTEALKPVYEQIGAAASDVV